MCEGGRRLFHTAFGDTVCDCPVGHYPFPGEDDDCVLLFTQGNERLNSRYHHIFHHALF